MANNEYESAIDTRLAGLYEQQSKLANDFDNAAHSAKSEAGAKFYYKGKQRVTDMTLAEAEQKLAEIIQENLGGSEYTRVGSYSLGQVRNTVERLRDLRVSLAAVRAEKERVEDLYTGWSRFFIVNNKGGHIHSSMSCHSCRVTTRFGWLPDMSGLTEADAVAAHGPHLCSFCFPTAPVEWTLGIGEDTPEDPDQCPGSGTHDHDSSGLRYYSKRAVCDHCHQTVSVTSTHKMRKHKKETK